MNAVPAPTWKNFFHYVIPSASAMVLFSSYTIIDGIFVAKGVSDLALAAVNGPEFIWRPAFGDTPGAPVLFPRWTFPELSTLPEGKGGGVVVKKYPEHLRTVGVRDEYELMDADSPQDLSFLAER